MLSNEENLAKSTGASTGTQQSGTGMFEEPITLAPTQDSQTAVPVHSQPQTTTTTTTQSSNSGLCSFIPDGVMGLTRFQLLCFTWMSLFILFTFCALCVSKTKLSQGEYNGVTAKCGASQACSMYGGNWICVDYNDHDDSKATKNAGNVFVTFGVFAFLLELIIAVFIFDLESNTLNDRLSFLPFEINTQTGHLVSNVILWFLLTISWGTWSNQRKGICAELNLGDGTNLLITVWFFHMFFYLPMLVPQLPVKSLLFGEQ